MTMREFKVAAREQRQDEDRVGEPVTFKHDDKEVTFLPPTTEQFLLLSATGVAGSDQEALGVYLQTFFDLMETDEVRRYFRNRFMDREDPFSLDSDGGVADIMRYLMEQWSGRPTKQPSDYQPPRSNTGRSSTARTRAKQSTSSRSLPAGSST